MSRFGYLDSETGKKAAKKAAKKARKLDKDAGHGKKGSRHAEDPLERGQVEVVYVRRETIRAAWRELKAEGGESLSELVDDLLLGWLQERQDAQTAAAGGRATAKNAADAEDVEDDH